MEQVILFLLGLGGITCVVYWLFIMITEQREKKTKKKFNEDIDNLMELLEDVTSQINEPTCMVLLDTGKTSGSISPEMEFQTRFSVDVDNCIFEYDTYKAYHFGEPKKGALEFFKRQHELGRSLGVHTARSDVEYNALYDHLQKHGFLPYISRIQLGKPYADVYIDDRAITFDDNWDSMDKLVNDQLAKQREKYQKGQKNAKSIT